MMMSAVNKNSVLSRAWDNAILPMHMLEKKEKLIFKYILEIRIFVHMSPRLLRSTWTRGKLAVPFPTIQFGHRHAASLLSDRVLDLDRSTIINLAYWFCILRSSFVDLSGSWIIQSWPSMLNPARRIIQWRESAQFKWILKRIASCSHLWNSCVFYYFYVQTVSVEIASSWSWQSTWTHQRTACRSSTAAIQLSYIIKVRALLINTPLVSCYGC